MNHSVVDSARWDLSPVEVESDIAFRDAAKRHAHVLKHVFGSEPEPTASLGMDSEEVARRSEPKKEQWRRVFGGEYLEALVDVREGLTQSPSVRSIEQAYEGMLSRLFRDKCREGRDHAHFANVGAVEFDEDKTAVPMDGEIKVFLACPSERVFGVAGAFVTSSRLGRYYLKSGFRPWPQLGGEGFRRRAREKLMRQKDRMRLVADHTQWGN